EWSGVDSIDAVGVTVEPDGRPARTVPVDVAPPPVTSDPAPVAFEALYRDEWPGLVALGWSLTGSWSAAEELVQDAFADAYRRWADVGRLERPGAWVRRAIVNRAASHHRHQAAARRGLTRLGARSAVDADAAGV